jgi:type IV pilus biogenesis protein CpaD/CtpE
MRTQAILLIAIVALGLGGCTRKENENDSAAREAGRTAHDIVNKAEKAAKKAEQDLEKAAKDAREGWKEGDREDKNKPHK